MPSDIERARTLVGLGKETPRTKGGWFCDARFSRYPTHWVIGNPHSKESVLHATDRKVMHEMLDLVMDELDSRVV